MREYTYQSRAATVNRGHSLLTEDNPFPLDREATVSVYEVTQCEGCMTFYTETSRPTFSARAEVDVISSNDVMVAQSRGHAEGFGQTPGK